MIRFENVTKTYAGGAVKAVDDLTLEIDGGKAFGFLGPNGAGKTTLLSLILDLIEPTKGYVKSKETLVSESDDWKNYTGSYLNEGFLIPFLTLSFYIFKFNYIIIIYD